MSNTAIDIEISEVGPRDGLQSIETIMATEDKKAWIKAQYEAGTPEIEVGSFVSPKLLPQLADTAEIVHYARSLDGLTVAVLAPNLRGLENAVTAGAHKVSIPFSMSESHSLKNLKKTHAQMLEEISRCMDFLRTVPSENRPKFEVGLSTAFGCTIEGVVPESRVIELAEKVIAMGVDEVGLSDTTGYGNPAQLKRLAEGIWANCGRDKLNGVHLHNTRGQGLANALMAVEIGITTIDSSLGGIGGCPWAPGASGNIVTEDLVFMLEAMGLKTGIDIDKLIAVRELVQAALPGEEMYGFTPSAGVPKGFTAAS
ncbi:MAG: hydroxymethylglutaryl-CoA lyase [Pseudomonadales bacterium]